MMPNWPLWDHVTFMTEIKLYFILALKGIVDQLLSLMSALMTKAKDMEIAYRPIILLC